MAGVGTEAISAASGRRASIVVVIAAVSASLLVPLALGGEDALHAALGFPARAYPLILGAVGVSWLCRALKLQLLLDCMALSHGFTATCAVSLASEFGFAATPAGIGGYAASVYYLRRAGATPSGAATITAADQVLDLIFFGLALPMAALAMPADAAPPGISGLLRWTSAVLFTGLCVAWLARKTLQRRMSAAPGTSPGLRRMGNTARIFLATLCTDAAVVMQGGPRFLCALLGLTALQWIARYGVLWLVLAALGSPGSFAAVFLLQAFVLHAAQWTGAPSGAGAVEVGIGAALFTSMPTVDLAAGLLVWRAATVYSILAAGAFAIAWLARRSASDATGAVTVG
jgi:glycosyltransferase 2 family protein